MPASQEVFSLPKSQTKAMQLDPQTLYSTVVSLLFGLSMHVLIKI